MTTTNLPGNLPFMLESPRPARVMEWAKAALLLGLGGHFAYIIVSGNLSNYINLRFAWLSYVAAALFLLIGGYCAFAIVRSARASTTHTGRAPLSWAQIAVIAIPLALGTLIPSAPLGADAIANMGVSTSGAIGIAPNNASVFSISPTSRNVLDWLRAFNNVGDPAEINGQPADVIGFVYLEPDFAPNQFMAARFTISCCVADSRAIGLPVVWDAVPNGDVEAALPQGSWVRVRGTMDIGAFRGDNLPILHAESVETVEQPKNPYLYP